MDTLDFIILVSSPGTATFLVSVLIARLWPRLEPTAFRLAAAAMVYFLIWCAGTGLYGVYWIKNHLCY